jgi:hypothetical protein
MRNGRGWVGWMAVALLLVSAAPARAIGIGWLEKLSGPGPFGGWNVGVPLFCFDLSPKQDESVTSPAASSQFSREAKRPDLSLGSWKNIALCRGYQDRPNRTLVIGFSGGSYKSLENDLEYAPSLDLSDKVKLDSYTLSFDVRVHPAVDIGVGIGLEHFRGEAFESFNRFSFEPLRIVVRPMALFLPDRPMTRGSWRVSWRDLIQVKFNARVYPEGFNARDFGSTGTFDQSVDVQFGLTVGVGVVFWLGGH